jgi:hypothetical protein
MSLPKIDMATFEYTQPSTGKILMCRPFTVKEEKILLMAKESRERKDIINAVKQVVNNCVIDDGFDAYTIPIFDLDYFFIKLRSISVGNICEFTVTDSNDGIEYKLELDLNDVEVTFPEKTEKKIMLTDDIGIQMKYPETSLTEKLEEINSPTELMFTLIMNCIDNVFTKDDVYGWSLSSEQEREEFLDQLSSQQYIKITDFFKKTPKIEHVITYVNSEQVEKKVYFRSLQDFFDLG